MVDVYIDIIDDDSLFPPTPLCRHINLRELGKGARAVTLV